MNCCSVSPFFHSSLHSDLTHSLISSRTSAGSFGWSKTMFWKLVARWISIASRAGKCPNASGGRVEAPCCTAPPSPYRARASRDSVCSASRSSWTLAIEPSGSTTPPWLVPVWTEILLIPTYGPPPSRCSVRVYPSMNASSSWTSEFFPPTSPISASSRRSEEHTSELQSLAYLVCRLLLEKKKNNKNTVL